MVHDLPTREAARLLLSTHAPEHGPHPDTSVMSAWSSEIRYDELSRRRRMAVHHRRELAKEIRAIDLTLAALRSGAPMLEVVNL